MVTQTSQFRFRRHDSIGNADAESDQEFLDSCFVDTGDLAVLRDCAASKRVIVGRTGAGKSALIRRLRETEEKVIELAPEVLSLNYLVNSTVLRFFEGLGVQLDPFYSLLWRHVFTVELLKRKFHIETEEKKTHFLAQIGRFLTRDKSKEKAIQYLQEWGTHFWEETEYRIKEFTTKLESELTGSVKGVVDVLSANAGEKFSEEQKHEVVQRAQRVVSSVQIKELHDVVRLLAEDIFDDPQQRFYIVIDRLDEGWVEERIRYKLLRALLEAVRMFQQVRRVKVVVALRSDLLDRVFRNTRDAGFQEEKYESLLLKLKWTSEQIESILDHRIDQLIRRSYTGQPVRLKELLPESRQRTSAIQYLLDRTFLRPREAIIFVNECLAAAEGKAQITWQMIRTAERTYSRNRLRSLADEWHADFPGLYAYTKLLSRRRSPFRFRDITSEEIEAFVLGLFEESLPSTDPVWEIGQEYLNSKSNAEAVSLVLVRALYQTGVIGIKPDAATATQWSYTNQPTISAAQVSPDAQLYVHETFQAVLGTQRD